MFDDEEFNEDEEMAPEEESFPVGSETKRKSPLSELRHRSGNGSSKDGQNLQNKIAGNKAKNASGNIARATGNSNKNGSQKGEGEENEEGQEEEDGKNSKANNAEQQGATEAAKLAAATAMQAAGVPKAIADKVSEKVLNSEQGQKLVNETIKKFKEQRRNMILKFVAPAIPYVLSILAVVIVGVMVMAQIMAIVEKVEGAFIEVSTGIEKFVNFTSGNGWNTEEELFFITLQEQYKESIKYSDNGVDIALLAATIHYSRGVDIGIYENDDSAGTDTSFSEDADTEQLFGSFLEAEDLKNFYYVANDKLGSVYAAELGKRRLIGHMFDMKISVHRTSDFEEAWNGLGRFLGFLGNTLDENIFERAWPGQWSKKIRTMFAYEETDSTTEGYFSYYIRNIRYEIDEFLAAFDDAYGENDSKVPDETGSGWFVYPSITLTYNEDKYYEYLVNVYIPGTYFPSGELTGAQKEEVERIAREIFQQRDNYNYLVNSEDTQSESANCRYTYGSSTTTTATVSGQNVDQNFIDNLMIELLDESCKTTSECTDADITDILTLKDYVMGVAYSEISASSGYPEEWIKANMVAIQSYTLNRNKDTLREEDGKFYLKMINSTRNQTFCSVTEGCEERETNHKGPLSSSSITYLEDIYSQIKSIFLYTSSGTFVGSYRSDYSMCVSSGNTGVCMGQNDSRQDADDGLSYENILGKYYTQDVGLLDISTSSLKASVYQCYSSGLVAGNHGNIMIRTTAPTSRDTYYNQPYVYNSNRGQCVWYVKGRASEIIATTVTDPTVQNTLLSVLRNATGNGNQWYNENLQKYFGSSDDYTKPKAGSIGVYDWTDQRCRDYWDGPCTTKYGHSIIIEDVNEAAQTVTYTDGYASGGSCPTNWDCVRFRYYQNVPISQLKDLGGGYIFIGYIYLLD